MSSLWVANGLLLGLLLLRPRGDWPRYLVAGAIGSIAARYSLGDAWPMMAGITAINLFETVAIAWIVRRRIPDITEGSRLLELARVAFVSTLLVCAVSGILAAQLVASDVETRYATVLLTWYVGHVLGIVIVATLAVVALREGRHLFGRPGRRWKFVRTMGLVAAVTLAVFAQSSYPLLFIVFPPLVWGAFRHRFAGVVVGITSVALISGIATGFDSGPIATIASDTERTLLLQVFIAAACLITLPLVVALTERSRFAARLRDRELRYRMLADHSRDVVVRMREDGFRSYVSPAAREVLGWEPAEMREFYAELIHPDDREQVGAARRQLLEEGGSGSATYRVRHRQGHYVWIEASGRRVDSDEVEGGFDIIYSARDITERRLAQQALLHAQQRLRAITDNIPALIAYIDHEHRYQFVNAMTGRLFRRAPESIIGRTVAEIHGEDTYRSVLPHLAAALGGERASYTGESDVAGRMYHFQANYVPDRDETGAVRGVFALTFDVTPLKQAELELERLARFDTLTGLANRRQFEERRDQALIRSRRYHVPVALMSLDIDHFKQINDRFGHAAGDEVLRQFAHRLRACVFDVDLVARLGGDEFVVLIENTGSAEIAELIAQKLLATMRTPVSCNGTSVSVTTSIGIVFCREAPSTETFMELADRALYAAKDAGRNTYHVVSHP